MFRKHIPVPPIDLKINRLEHFLNMSTTQKFLFIFKTIL